VREASREAPSRAWASWSRPIAWLDIFFIHSDISGETALAAILRTGICVRYPARTDDDQALALRPDVAVIDIGLPGLDGYEVARRIRAAGDADVLLVAVTGYGQSGDRQRSNEAGFDAHLTKPVDPVALETLLVNLPLDPRRTAR